MLEGLAWLAALLVAVVLTLLAVPLHFGITLEWRRPFVVRWRFTWLFGLVERSSASTDRPARSAPSPTAPADSARTMARSAKRSRPGLSILAALRSRGFLRRAIRFLGDLVRQVKWERFHLDAEYGFDDPSDTGRLCAALSPLLVGANLNGWNARCRPRFDQPCLAGSCDAAIRIRPLSVLIVAASFACSPASLRALRAARSARR